MRKVGSSLAVAIAALAVVPAKAMAKEICCYRVHVNTSNAIQHEDQGGSGAGAQNGTYSMSTQWEVRELMSYETKGPDDISPVITRNGRQVQGRGKFKGSESSEQWYMDTSNPPMRVNYPPCRYVTDVPWRRGSDFFASPGLFYFTILTVGSPEWPLCDNTSPHLSPLTQWYHPGGGATASGSDDSYWEADETTVNTYHFEPSNKVRKLSKMKDLKFMFEPPTITETSQQPPYTATITHRTVIRFTWFPYDRLQKELNELNGLK